MVAINKNIWERLGPGESLLFQTLLPFLLDEQLYKMNLNRLSKTIYKKSLQLFPDIEEAILPGSSSGGPSRHRPMDPLGVYLSEVKSFGVSGREEEYVLARCLELARLVLYKEISSLPGMKIEKSKILKALGTSDPALQDYLSQLRVPGNDLSAGPATYRTRLEKLNQRIDEMNRIRSLLVSRNLHLVPKFARRFRKLGVPYQDLIQEGNASLLRAADKFDWKRGVRFSTYAHWWINQAMLKSLYCQSRIVRLPVYLNQKMKRIRDANQESWGKRGRDLTAEQISENLDEPVSRIRRALRANVGTFSLDQEVESGEDYSLRDLLVDRHREEYREVPEGPTLKDRIAELLKSLPEKERRILVLRYGLEGRPAQTLEEVSRQFGVSRERIRQIQVQALRKLLQPSKKQKLSSFLG